METLVFLLILFIAFILILVFINAVLLSKFSKTSKNIDLMLENGKIKDLKDVLLGQIEKSRGLDFELKKALERIQNIEISSLNHFQKIGVVRFNPFVNMGGNQSFVIALLDNKNNGFLISSFFGKEGNRLYAKTVKNGKSELSPSQEELEALKRAIGTEKIKK